MPGGPGGRRGKDVDALAVKIQKNCSHPPGGVCLKRAGRPAEHKGRTTSAATDPAGSDPRRMSNAMEVEATGASGDVATEATPVAAADDAGRGKAVEHAAPSSETRGATEQVEDDSGGQKAVGDEAGSPDPAPAQEGDAAHIPVAAERSAADPSTPADKAAKPAGKLKAQVCSL